MLSFLSGWRRNSGIFLFDSGRLAEIAERHRAAYASGEPFPHAVMDDFLPEEAAETVRREFPGPQAPNWLDWRTRDTVHQPKKLGIGSAERLQGASAYVQQVLLAFNSGAFINFLEKLTGIGNLVPDPHFTGGGLHQILSGGKLAIHADFNFSNRLKLYRRINALLYLNRDWKEEYGGHLELWDKGMTRCVSRIAPVFNRCVIFNTDSDSYHGHPEPLACPEHVTRKSLALYYYTSLPGSGHPEKVHSTDWQERPQDRKS